MTPASEKSINKLIKLMDDGEEVRKFIRVKDAVSFYCIGRTLLVEKAKEAGALYKVGGVLLINAKEFDLYIESCKVTNEEVG